MRRVNWPWIAAILIVCSGAMLLAPAGWSPFAAAQEEAENEERTDDRDAEARLKELKRRLDEIEGLIERAEQGGDKDRIRQLRREGEQLLDRLEEIERARKADDDGEEDERSEEREELARHAYDLEVHRLEFEIQRLHQELQVARQEASVRLVDIAESKLTSASYAISQAVDELEEEAAIDFLADMKDETENETILRIIRHHLASLYHHADQPDAARRELRALILGE